MKYLMLLLFSSNLYAHGLVSKHAFFSDEYNNGYPEKKYHAVLDKFIEIYTPIIAEKGGTFHILRDFTDGAVNAWAWRIGQEYHLEVPGGLSRYHLINEEAFIITVCHELGHLLGGAPARFDTISFEGQSDYYATTHCAKRMFKEIPAYKVLVSTAEIQLLCQGQADQELCTKLLAGSQSITNYFAFLEGSTSPSLSSESTQRVRRTSQKHPKAQCRLDTLKRGAFCFKKESEISYEDPYRGYCKEIDLKRPPCWFVD